MSVTMIANGREIPISHPHITNRQFKGDRLVKVRLYGRLALVAGREVFELAVSSVREAITALHYLTEGRTTRYIDQTSKSVRWRVLINGNQLDGDRPSIADELMIERNGIETIEIYPVPEGAANIFGLILGAILIVVGVVLAFIPGANLLAAEFIIAGVAGVLGGLVSLFEKPAGIARAVQQKKNPTQGNPSYLFGGTVNTQDQGGCVPVAYGNVMVGSQCIGASVQNSDIFQTLATSYAEWQVPVPYAAKDDALAEATRAIRPDSLQLQTAAVSTPWNELGGQTFWGYVAQVTLVPYAFDTETPQQPIYDNGPYWLMRTINGGLAANYQPGGNYGPWTGLKTLPQEIDSIIVTQLQDNYIGYAPTPHLP